MSMDACLWLFYMHEIMNNATENVEKEFVLLNLCHCTIHTCN